MDIVEKVRTGVYKVCMHPNNAFGIGAWTHHIDVVYRIARENHELYGADLEVVSLAALLHDIASVKDKSLEENHHIEGAKLARVILTRFDYDPEKISLIEKCILNHRGSIVKEKSTPEEICISDSDALAHIYEVPSLLRMMYVEQGLDIDDGAKKVSEKLERSYNKLSETGKRIGAERYKAAQKVLKKD